MTRTTLRQFVRTAAIGGVLLHGVGTSYGSTIVTIDIGRGPVPVAIPDSYDPATPAPLLVGLHALGWTGESMESHGLALGPSADANGYIYTYPTGRLSTESAHYWDATDFCCDIVDPNTDEDSIYLRDLIDEIERQYNVDDKRIYVIGRSNGGCMAYRMACDHSEKIAAAVSMAGPMYNPHNADNNPDNGEDYCQPTQPVHILDIFGSTDLDYDGGEVMWPGTVLHGRPFPGSVESRNIWNFQNGCLPDVNLSGGAFDFTSDDYPDRDETAITYWPSACHVGSSTTHWKIVGVGHNPQPYKSEFYVKLFDYFANHTKEELQFVDNDTIAWPAIHAAKEYEVYRGDIQDLFDGNADGLPDLGYGDCVSVSDPDITDTVFEDTEEPLPSEGFFYNFTFIDIINPMIGGGGNEGNQGKTSSGITRPNLIPCP